jgi:predicted acyl esterase
VANPTGMPRSAVRLALSAALLTGVALTVPAQAAPVPNEATWTQQWIESGDGTLLHADVLLPKDRSDDQKHPVILSIGPYFGSGSQNAPGYQPTEAGPSDRFSDLIEDGEIFDKGYAFVMVDSRGYGSSGGCNDLGGPGEQMDVKAAVEWAATQSWSTGKVGMWGKSYDAWTQVMGLATDPKGLAATVIQAPIIDGYRIAFENGVHWSAGWYVTPSLYLAYDAIPPSLVDATAEEFVHSTTGTATNLDCYARNLVSTPNPDRTADYWKERDLVAAAGASTVPSLWSFGFNDVNTKPTNIFDVYSELKGPKRAWFGQWDHVRGNEEMLVGREGFMDEAMSWFDHHLQGRPLKKLPQHEVQDGDGVWRTEASYPPADAVGRSMPVKAGSYVDEMGNSSRDPSNGTWTVSQPAPHDVRLAGLTELSVEATTSGSSGANLVALLYDVDPDGTSRLITRGAYRIPASGTTRFEMWPADWLLPKGHRLALQLSADDAVVYQPTYTGSAVTVTKGAVTLPLLTKLRTSDLEGDEAGAQARVPSPTLPASSFEGREVRADFGKPMRR